MSAAVGKLGSLVLAVQRALIALTALALALLMIIQIVLRYWLKKPFLGIEEIAVLLGLWFYFLGSSYATRTDAHIKGGVAELVIKNPHLLATVRLAGTLVCLAVSILFMGYAALYWHAVWESGRKSAYMGWPTTIWVTSMVVGFVLMASYLVLQACRDLGSMRSQGENQ